MADGTQVLGEVGDAADLVFVPIHHGCVNLEWQPDGLAGLDPRKGLLKGSLDAAELVVTGPVEAVDGDAHCAGSRFLEALCRRHVDERAVGAEHRAQALGAGVCHQLEDVAAHEWLSAGEDHHLEARVCYLVDHALGFFCSEL